MTYGCSHATRVQQLVATARATTASRLLDWEATKCDDLLLLLAVLREFLQLLLRLLLLALPGRHVG